MDYGMFFGFLVGMLVMYCIYNKDMRNGFKLLFVKLYEQIAKIWKH